MSLSVLVASSGRPTLIRTIESITPQLLPGDELIVDVNDDAPWGHAARNRMMPRAKGDALLFMDDDDSYMPGALTVVRDAFARTPDRPHIFKMRYANGRELWVDRQVRCGNVSTQMFVALNGMVGQWGDRYEGDFDFIASTVALQGEPVWHPDVIALIRPS